MNWMPLLHHWRWPRKGALVHVALRENRVGNIPLEFACNLKLSRATILRYERIDSFATCPRCRRYIMGAAGGAR